MNSKEGKMSIHCHARESYVCLRIIHTVSGEQSYDVMINLVGALVVRFG
jgi:hypothetical protein